MLINSGKILKGIGGFYYVETELGIIECKARGKFRKDDITPIVGDNVRISIDEDNKGYLLDIFERSNSFIRPPVANIDKLLIVSSVANPSPNTFFIDKMLVIAHESDVEPAICFNKCDLEADISNLVDIYKNAGYKVFVTSTKNNIGIEEVKQYMVGSVMAVCGFSGVGKSSLLNKLTDSDKLLVGDISKKLSRGKHTTKHVELIKLSSDTYIADTPGFSSLSVTDNIDADTLIKFFPELYIHTKKCKFSDCSHNTGKFCGVYDALCSGDVSKSRYDNYIFLYNNLKEKKEWKK